MKAIVTIPVTEEQKQRLLNSAEGAELIFIPGGWFRSEEEKKLLSEAEAILGNVKIPGQLREAKALRWIQLNSAGTEGYCKEGVLPKDVILTNATGAYGLAISEHMIGCLLMLSKKLHLYYQNQLKERWRSEGNVTAIEGSTVLSIGMGDIGGTFLQKMKALGAYTIGVKRSASEKPPFADEQYTAEEFAGMEQELLSRADTVALSMPGNEETRQFFDARRLSYLKQSAVFLNVGRGSAVDTDALCRMLYEGRLSGAALDVTDPEPLPEGHPLWKAPNCIITPHISGHFFLPETLSRIVDICAENLRRYQKGEALKNQVDRGLGYARI